MCREVVPVLPKNNNLEDKKLSHGKNEPQQKQKKMSTPYQPIEKRNIHLYRFSTLRRKITINGDVWALYQGYFGRFPMVLGGGLGCFRMF